MFVLEQVNMFPGGDYAQKGGEGKQIWAFQPLPFQEAWVSWQCS
jgi:hypothetical protein